MAEDSSQFKTLGMLWPMHTCNVGIIFCDASRGRSWTTRGLAELLRWSRTVGTKTENGTLVTLLREVTVCGFA